MKRPTVVLFTITNQTNVHTLGLYNLKAYALKHLIYSSKPSIVIKIYKSKKIIQNNYSTFFSLTLEEINQIVNWILKKKPKIVGFSCWLSNSRVMLQIAERIKKKNKDIKLIFGGPETYHNFFYDTIKIMKKEGAIDIIARYEGEEVFTELLESILYNKRDIDDIKGITYRNNNNILVNQERSPMRLDKIPSPYSKGIMKVRKNAKDVAMEISRGCPYRCSYCSYPLGNYRYYRSFPLERINNDLIFLFNKKVRFINFVESNFNVYEERAKKILKIIMMHDNKYTKIGIFCNASRKLLDEKMAKLFFLSRIMLNIGVQSINPNALHNANRNTNIKILEKNLSLLDRHNVKYVLEFIYGLPGDSFVNIKNVINWIFKFRAQRVIFYRLCIERGTPFFFQRKELGLKYIKVPPFVVSETKELSKSELKKIEELLAVAEFFYSRYLLRKIIYQINAVFSLDYVSIFEQFIQWNTSFKPKQWTGKHAYKLLTKYFSYLLRTKNVNLKKFYSS